VDYVPSPHVEVHLTERDLAAELAADVRRGLSAPTKSVPARWLYDPRGCELFEAITALPEYYPTRAEREILSTSAAEIASLARPATLIELGSGSSEKTRWLIDAMVAVGTLERFVAFDVSEPTLRDALAALADEYPSVEATGVVGDFERHLGDLPDGASRLVAFLGGTIGNLDRAGRHRFLADLAAVLVPGEHLLLGTDLIKDPARLVAAYDDAQGVTAAFERNVLEVINRALGAHFDPERFIYSARWNDQERCIEMGLQSDGDQTVRVDALDLDVELISGEEIRTEISAKFTMEQLEAELRSGGFVPVTSWTDTAGDFAVTLARRAPQ
jgi:L-histidine N-alpha-methyltransferase